MLKNQVINLKAIAKLAMALGDINDEVIYIGGAVVSLYVTDKAAEQARPTKDIDISVQVSSYVQMNELQKRLAAKGIYPAVEESVLYRYVYEDILVDFIPFDSTSLGPSNKWLKPGFNKAYWFGILDTRIKLLPVAYFVATKWEAFKNRGGDPRMSPDFEDIIYIIDNNKELLDDIIASDRSVRVFLKEMAVEILAHHSLYEIIECHINPFTALERRKIIVEKLEKIGSFV